MNNSNRSKILLILGTIAAVAIMPARAARVDDTIATVNNKPIFLSRYRKELAATMNDMAQANPMAMRDPNFIKQIKGKVLDDLIDQELLYLQGKTLNIKVHPDDVDKALSEIKARFDVDENGNKLTSQQAQTAFEKQLTAMGLSYDQYRKRLEKQVMAKKVLDQEVKSKVEPPSSKQTRAYFDEITTYIASGSTVPPSGIAPYNAQDFLMAVERIKSSTAERVKVSRILIRVSPRDPDAEKRRALRDSGKTRDILMSGTSTFSEIARDYSEDPASAAHGGDIGYIPRGALPPTLDKAVFSLAVGQVSEPLLNDEGYNIIRIQSHQAAEKPEYDRFKDYLKNILMDVESHKIMDSYIKSLRAQAVIVKHMSALR
jgi:parvulin-like peptidyl-prolyl isomerase